MKSMLYIGATLMIGASIYGFVDYRQTSNKKEFTEMYEPAVKKTTVVTPETETPSPGKQEAVAVVKKPTRATSKTNENQESTEVVTIMPAVEVTEENVILPDEAVTTVEVIEEKEKTPIVESKATEKKVVKKKKKKLNHRLFSRAPLREEEEIDEAPVKEVVKKTENKEQ